MEAPAARLFGTAESRAPSLFLAEGEFFSRL